MASSRGRHRDKQLDALVKENSKLHQDVVDLESAYLLHQQNVQEDLNGVRGLIRKEVGGSRWQHGASGKLRTYKSSKDLGHDKHNTDKLADTFKDDSNPVGKNDHGIEWQVDSELESNKRDSVEPSNNRNKGSSKTKDTRVKSSRRKPVIDLGLGENDGSNVDQERILNLKTKVLQKASSNVIKRDKWPSPDVKEKTKTIEDYKKVSKVMNGSFNTHKSSKHGDSRKTNKTKKDKNQVSKAKSETEQSEKLNDLPGLLNGSNVSTSRKSSPQNVDIPSVRQSRRDLFKTETTVSATLNELQNRTVDADLVIDKSVSKSNSDKLDSKSLKMLNGVVGVTYTPRKFEPLLGDSDGASTGLFSTQPPEPTEIYIDPENVQVRVRSGNEATFYDMSDLNRTKVCIQPGSVHKSMEGNKKISVDIVEQETKPSQQNEIRDIFGHGYFDNGPNSNGISDPLKYGRSSASPFAAAKDCNTEVEFWLRGLGLTDVERIVNVFADNDIDLLDLEFMSASQLHDMGIVALGDLDRILKGVQTIKNVPKVRNSHGNGKSKLYATSVAWEDIDRETVKKNLITKSNKKASTHKTKTKNSDRSCQSETFTKETSELKFAKKSADFISDRANDMVTERCNSVMSNLSDTADSVSSSKMSSSTQNASFAAMTKSSSAKCMDKRPPSAKIIHKTNQSVLKNSNQSGKTVNQAGTKLRRSNSAASDKPASKLSNLDAKPTKGVLLRARSSSLTRESLRTQNKVTKKGQDDNNKKGEEDKVNKGQRSRFRSQSVDTAKRKAQEGVQAAARKYEDKQQRCKTDSTQAVDMMDDRKKLRRDEMAARHIQREKYKETTVDESSDTGEESTQEATPILALGEGLESLVTVNILSHPSTREDSSTPHSQDEKSKTRQLPCKADVRKSLRRVEVPRRQQRQSSTKPVHINGNSHIEPPLLSTYKIGGHGNQGNQVKDDGDHGDRDKSQSEPESGYKTDGSTTYSQIEERVTDIQHKIKRLKSRALSGDDMTLTLVRELQSQLQYFERQLTEKEIELRGQRSNELRGQRSNRDPEVTQRPSPRVVLAQNGAQSHVTPAIQLSSTPRQRVEEGAGGQPDPGDNMATIDTQGKGDNQGKDTVRMSKRELLDEMRKEKKQHHRQIRQLQSELQRIRHTDPVTSMELDPREIVYTQTDMVGEGTFSKVYKGQYQGSEVAIKRLNMPLQSQDNNYFAAEVSLLKELRHPRVVLLIGVCTTNKLPVMVLEYMSRGSLFNHLHNPHSECLDHALYYQIARDIATGMNYLHSHKPEVLHLDLKSMNVLLCQSLRAKIADFGFSKLRHDAGIKTGPKSKNSSTPGIPWWMAPELLDKGEVTGKADVYSYGIILWEMLTRKLPYHSKSLFKVLEMVRKNKRPEIPAMTPEGLRHLIQLCWDPNQAKRPQFKDVIQILENLSFPPAWRELFQQAGVPEEALHNVQSTRTIISLVNSTLDSTDSSMMQSFMLPQHSEQTVSQPESRSASASARSIKSENQSKKLKTKTSLLDDRDSPKRMILSLSREVIDIEDEWESDTVSTLSGMQSCEESEFTLKNLRESVGSSTQRSDSDESSILTSDDERTVVVSPRQPIRASVTNTDLNIPNLELSLQSAREQFASERERINRTSDWLCISLDGSTDRSNEGYSQRSSQNSTRQHSNMSCGSETGLLNECARSKRRNKSKDLPLYSEEFLMRESFHNRRPPSPKKRMSLSQKLLRRSTSSASTVDQTDADIDLELEGIATGAAVTTVIDSSYDSFFSIPIQRAPRGSASARKGNKIVSELPLSHDLYSIDTNNSNHSGESSRKTKETDLVDSKDETLRIELVPKINLHDNEMDISNIISSGRTDASSSGFSDDTVVLAKAQGLDNTMVALNDDTEIDDMSRHKTHGSANKETVENEYTGQTLNINQVNTTKQDENDNSFNEKKNKFNKVFEQMKEKQVAQDLSINLSGVDNQTSKEIRQSDGKSPCVDNETRAIQVKDVINSQDICNIIRTPCKGSEKTIHEHTDLKIAVEEVKEPIRVKLNMSDVESKTVVNDVTERTKPTITPRQSKMSTEAKSRTDTEKRTQKDDVDFMKTVSEHSINTSKHSKESASVSRDTVNNSKKISISDSHQNCDDLARTETKPTSKTPKNTDKSDQDNRNKKESYHSRDKEPSTSSTKNTIRVKLRKDPLAPKLSSEPVSRSPIPPAPPPPPPVTISMSYTPCSKSVQDQPRCSMADELKSKLMARQSISEGMSIGRGASNTNNTGRPVKQGNVIGQHPSKSPRSPRVPSGKSHSMGPNKGEPRLMKINELDDSLVPQPSDGLPSFVVQSLDLRDQKDHLRSISQPHPDQLDDLSGASQEQLHSIAEILKKAVIGRRLAMGEESVSQSLDSVATGWSVDLG